MLRAFVQRQQKIPMFTIKAKKRSSCEFSGELLWFYNLEKVASLFIINVCVLCSGLSTEDLVTEEEEETAAGWRNPEMTETGPNQPLATNALNSESVLLSRCGRRSLLSDLL